MYTLGVLSNIFVFEASWQEVVCLLLAIVIVFAIVYRLSI